MAKIKLKVSLIDPNLPFWTPTGYHHGDVGYDLFIARDYEIPPATTMTLDHNLSIELPPNTWGMLVGRSSSFTSRKLHVMTGVIDNSYRGPINATVLNISDTPVRLHSGNRIAQLLLMPLVSLDVEFVDPQSLSKTGRGEEGFGSTGK